MEPILGILSLICLAYLGHEEEKELVKIKLIRRASLVNIRGHQARVRLHRVDEINKRHGQYVYANVHAESNIEDPKIIKSAVKRTKHESCFNNRHRNRLKLKVVDSI